MYPLPPDPNNPMPQRIFQNIPSTESIVSVISIANTIMIFDHNMKRTT